MQRCRGQSPSFRPRATQWATDLSMNWIQRYWYRMRSSFWFVPSVIVLGMMALALATIELDTRIDADVLEDWPRLFGAGAQGSRSLLATVAGSMITVAGTVFSITLVALSLTSSQYSSRVLRGFMNDRSNQAVLGVFVGIFAYCLVVLRVIRDGDSQAFVPSLSVLGGVVLGLLGIGVLVFFIHHIAVSIQASHIAAMVARETLHAIDHLFPADEPRCPGRSTAAVVADRSVWQTVTSTRNGYLQQIDAAALLDFARRHAGVVRVDAAIGDFVLEGAPLLAVNCATPLGRPAVDWLRSCFAIGRQRTLEQDIGFGLRQLVDVAIKALSPGINDTTTAILCINQLTAVLRVAGTRTLRFAHCSDGEVDRVLMTHPDYAGLLDTAFGELRQSARGNAPVLQRLLWMGEQLAAPLDDAARIAQVRVEMQQVADVARRSVEDPVARRRFD